MSYLAVPFLTRITGEAINCYRLMRLNSSNQWVFCDAGEMPLAVAESFMASALPLTGRLLRRYPGTVELTASGAIDQFAKVYSAADGKISMTNTGVCVGMALAAASGNGSVIEVLPEVQRVPYVNTAASAAVGASSTAEADFDKTFFIPASELKAGSIVRIRASGLCVGAVTAPQLDIRLYAGTEVLATITNADVVTADQFLIEGEFVVRTLGASGTLVGAFAHILDAAGTAIGVRNKAEATEDTTAGLTIKLSAQFDASNAGNTARLDTLVVEHLVA